MSTSKVVASSALTALALCLASTALALSPQERLGKLLYEDTSLSVPEGQSCKTCHHPSAGFADPMNRRDPINWPVSLGADGVSVGGRNAPTAAYAAYSPVFSYVDGIAVGGQFWDGRAATLAEQALGPFENPLEMASTRGQVVTAVLDGPYSRLFQSICGRCPRNSTAWEAYVEDAFVCVGESIAAFESTQILNKFSSKYDASIAGVMTLTAQEAWGLALFNDPEKGNCAACHPSTTLDGSPPLFTDFTYDNLGIPKSEHRLLAANDVDLGLGGALNDSAEDGKFKVPTLRNVAKTAPYGHNGYFATLDDIVDFYNTRDDGSWPDPEVAANMNELELGNLGLTEEEVDAIVAFLITLSDGLVECLP